MLGYLAKAEIPFESRKRLLRDLQLCESRTGYKIGLTPVRAGAKEFSSFWQEQRSGVGR